MTFSPVVAALLCFTTWMAAVHASHAPVSSCCSGWSKTKVPMECIVNYTIQTEGACLINAIVFKGKRGGRICSDPNSNWAKKVMRKVDEEKQRRRALQENGQNEEGLTSDVTPTVSLPLENKPQKKGRKVRRCLIKKSRKGRRGQKKNV